MKRTQDIIEIPSMSYFDAAMDAAIAEAVDDHQEIKIKHLLPPAPENTQSTKESNAQGAVDTEPLPESSDTVSSDQSAEENNPSQSGTQEPEKSTENGLVGPDRPPTGTLETNQTAEQVEAELAPAPDEETDTAPPTESSDINPENETEIDAQDASNELPVYLPHENEAVERKQINAVAVIDTRVINYEQLVAIAQGDVILINENTSLDEINNLLSSTEQEYTNIEIWAHAEGDGLTLGEHQIDSETDAEDLQDELRELSQHVTASGAINFFGCNVAETATDIAILERVAVTTERTVRGSNNLTGEDGDFVLEFATDGSTGYESDVFAAAELENVSTTLAFVNGGLINQQVYHQQNTNGSVTLIFNRAYDSSGGAWRSFDEGRAFAHAFNTTISGESFNDWHLGEWMSRAEYEAWTASFSSTEWQRFEGMIFAGRQFGTNETDNRFYDNEGRRYNQQIGGQPQNPDFSWGSNYANWDHTDTVEQGELGIIVYGYRINSSGQQEWGELHEVPHYYDPDSRAASMDAVWIQTERVIGAPNTANTPSTVLIEQDEAGLFIGSVNPFEDTTISVGGNAYAYQYYANATNWTAGQMTYSFDGGSISDATEAKFNVSINNTTGNVSIKAVSGQEPTASEMRQMLDGITLQITGSVDQPDISSLTGIGVLTTKDIFAQNVTMTDSGNYTIQIEDRPDATPGEPTLRTANHRSGHAYFEYTNPDYALDNFNFPNISDEYDAHGIVMENDWAGSPDWFPGDGVYAWYQFELDSRDDNLASFRMYVDNPSELLESPEIVRSEILFDPPATADGFPTGFSVTLVHDANNNEAYYEFTPDDASNGMRAYDVEQYINNLTIDVQGENPTPTKLTFSYEWTDLDGNFDRSTDGYQGDKPGGDPDFGRTVVLILPINDMPLPELPDNFDPGLPLNHMGFAIEEAGYYAPFDFFTLGDLDTNPSAARIVIETGWVQGDREIDVASLIVDNPKLDFIADDATGELLITIKQGETATAADFEKAIKEYKIRVADNQPDLTDLTGYIRVYDEVNETMQSINAATGDQYADASFVIGVKDRLELSAGAPGAGENTGHDGIPDQIRTDTFNEQLPESELADRQAIAVENGDSVNPFDDAVFEHLQVGANEINFEVVSGWIPGQSEWLIDYAAFESVGIIVTDHGDGNITFTPQEVILPQAQLEAPSENSETVAMTFYNEMDPAALGETLRAGAIMFIVNGENVQTETAVFRITGEDGHTLTETSLDTLNNVDADEDGLFRILQLGVNDAPILAEPNTEEPGDVYVVIEAGETIYPFTQMSVSDIDSENMQVLNIEPDGDVSNIELTTTAAAQDIIDTYDVEITRNEQTGWTLTGTMQVEDFNTMLQGIGFMNADDALENEGATDVLMVVTVLDVSETGFDDHLDDTQTASLSIVNTPEPVDPPEPRTPTPVVEVVQPNRHISEEDRLFLDLLDPNLPPEDPVNVHVSLFVRGLDYELEAQTDEMDSRLISKETRSIRDDIQENGIDRFNEIILLAHNVGVEDGIEQSEVGTYRAKASYGLAR